ncbi:putative transposase [Neisseria meningitidis NM606]|nr:putative transposase [Neisseria meningitidis NM606]
MLPWEYEDNTLQIKEKSTERTDPFFVLEVTARSAADILGIHPNSAVLFYRKIRTVINHHLALAADEVFEGPVEPDESDFGGRRKGDVVAVRRKSGCLRHSETQRTGLYRCGG